MTLQKRRFKTVTRSSGRLSATVMLSFALLISPVFSGDGQAERHKANSSEDVVFNPDLSRKLQKSLEEVARLQGIENISASLYISDKCNWQGSTGTVAGDPVGKTVDASTLYRFASITKTFVAAIILQLAEDKVLQLEDPISKWLDEFENIDADITVRQLLNHSSGLNGYIGRRRFWKEVNENRKREWPPQEALTYVREPLADPGMGVHYSNTNYTLLGLIIEAATGNLVEQELSERILIPLNLRDTTISVGRIDPERWAISKPPSLSLSSAIWTAGALISTPRDIAKWAAALFSGKVLKQDALNNMLVFEKRKIGGTQLPMGLGIWDVSSNGIKAWGHGGRLRPFLAKLIYLPDIKLGVAYAFTGGRGQGVPGKHLVETFLSNQPGDISKCFNNKN